MSLHCSGRLVNMFSNFQLTEKSVPAESNRTGTFARRAPPQVHPWRRPEMLHLDKLAREWRHAVERRSIILYILQNCRRNQAAHQTVRHTAEGTSMQCLPCISGTAAFQVGEYLYWQLIGRTRVPGTNGTCQSYNRPLFSLAM